MKFFFVFSTTARLYSECLLNETRHRQSGKVTGKHEGSPTLSQNFMTLVVHKRLKMGPDFLPALCKFCVLRASLPGVAHGSQQTGPNHICQTDGGKWSWCEPNKTAPHSEYKCNHRNCVVGVRKLKWLPFRVVSKYPQCVVWFYHKARVWQTDRQTDRVTDGQNYDSYYRASIAACAVINEWIAENNKVPYYATATQVCTMDIKKKYLLNILLF